MSASRSFAVSMLVAVVMTLGIMSSSRAQDASAPFSGTWKWTMQGFNGDQEIVLKLKQDGDKVTGTISNPQGDGETEIKDGMVKADELTFKVVRDFNGNQFTTNYSAKIVGGALKGKQESVFSRDFEAKKS
jgi:hypothetical protein